ncbi:MAG: DUF1217 domain-containing protein [Paracoccaceae bacterium]
MAFQPLVPTTGYAGWKFLSRTLDKQRAAFNASADLARKTEYFRDNIGSVKTADALVGDRRLLEVALGAFGLDDDIGAKAFIRKVLNDGTLDTSDLANRLADKNYREFSKAFGFGDFKTPRTALSDFGETIAARYRERRFEAAVGEVDGDLRLALGAERALSAIAGKSTANDTKWLEVMGSLPLRKVFETAFGLPQSFASLDLDRQMDTLKDKADARFGSADLAQFSEPENVEKLVRLFLLRSEIGQSSRGLSAASNALTMLQASQANRGL